MRMQLINLRIEKGVCFVYVCVWFVCSSVQSVFIYMNDEEEKDVR